MEIELRDLFAVHAPPMPKWFRAARSDLPEIQHPRAWLKERGLPVEAVNHHGYLNLDLISERFVAEAVTFNAARARATQRREDRHGDGLRQAAIDWPYWWADQQVSRRNYRKGG